jgi:hypothetical protein
MFCVEISHVIGWIVVQSLPLGQQSNVVFCANGMQVEVEGQQKPEGNPALLHCV